MNNLRDIYTNVFENIQKFYSSAHYNNEHGKLNIPISTIFDHEPYKSKWSSELYPKILNTIIDPSVNTNIALYIGNFNNLDGIIDIETDNQKQTYIPIYITFSMKNTPINEYYVINQKGYINSEKVNFIINILTHKFEGSNTVNISNSVRAHEYFYRQFNYKEFSIDIFNHIYQPRFQLIRHPENIKSITDTYLIDLSSMGSIFINDPVNKRLLGLPKINIDGINKPMPDVFKILQDQGVNYRKVILSGSHNPFIK